jgi:hypothetical protein
MVTAKSISPWRFLMRAIVLAALAALVLGSVAWAEPVAYQPGGFPRDEVSLRALDNAQLRIVRRAGAQCWHSLEGGFGSRSVQARGCIIGQTESAVRSSEDAALVSYHNALPFHARYDEYRPAYYWQRMVMR